MVKSWILEFNILMYIFKLSMLNIYNMYIYTRYSMEQPNTILTNFSSFFVVKMSTIKFNTMYYVNFFEKLCFILITICHTFRGQLLKNDLENNLFCGLSKKQIHEAMSYNNNKYKTKGIAKNLECLEERNMTNDCCLAEQYDLIECLHKEYFLANEQGNEVIENNLANKDKKLQDMIKKRILQNIIDENETLDIMAKDYDETIVQHFQSIDDLMKKTICVDDINKALTNTKVELTTVLRQQILKNNTDKISTLGIYHN